VDGGQTKHMLYSCSIELISPTSPEKKKLTHVYVTRRIDTDYRVAHASRHVSGPSSNVLKSQTLQAVAAI
jgi:hypothetical protein